MIDYHSADRSWEQSCLGLLHHPVGSKMAARGQQIPQLGHHGHPQWPVQSWQPPDAVHGWWRHSHKVSLFQSLSLHICLSFVCNLCICMSACPSCHGVAFLSCSGSSLFALTNEDILLCENVGVLFPSLLKMKNSKSVYMHMKDCHDDYLTFVLCVAMKDCHDDYLTFVLCVAIIQQLAEVARRLPQHSLCCARGAVCLGAHGPPCWKSQGQEFWGHLFISVF